MFEFTITHVPSLTIDHTELWIIAFYPNIKHSITLPCKDNMQVPLTKCPDPIQQHRKQLRVLFAKSIEMVLSGECTKA